ncbi:MAG: hypothetical protein IIC50_14805, partial [Planctomycetes bacterium]|nr:hypothetical protein [Planctomycetota bacterium]
MKSMLKYVSAAAHIFVVALILIGPVHCLQGIPIESAKLFVRKPERIQRQSDPARRSFVFLPDGTLHQIRTISDANDLAGRSIEEVYDANNTLVIRRHSSKEPDQTYLSFPFPLNTPSLDDRYMIEPAFSST